MRDRRDYLIAVLAAALLFCVGLLAGQTLAVLPAAEAQGSPNTGDPIPKPTSPVPGPTGVTIEPNRSIRPGFESRSYAPTASDSNANNRFVAITCPVGSGESVLFILDSKQEQLAAYRYVRGKGLAFLAGRKIDYDLRISQWKDISDFSRDEMKRLFDQQAARVAAEEAKGKKSR